MWTIQKLRNSIYTLRVPCVRCPKAEDKMGKQIEDPAKQKNIRLTHKSIQIHHAASKKHPAPRISTYHRLVITNVASSSSSSLLSKHPDPNYHAYSRHSCTWIADCKVRRPSQSCAKSMEWRGRWIRRQAATVAKQYAFLWRAVRFGMEFQLKKL